MPNIDKEKLLQYVRSAVEKDKELRESLQIGEKFRFIRDRLNALLKHVEENLQALEKKEDVNKNVVASDETVAYVYLYNTHGQTLQTWQKMVTPKVFYEYSVNRPIYTDQSHIEAAIRGKTTKNQHAYLAIIIKKSDILKPEVDSVTDPFGHPLIKVKEGSLQFKKLVFFKHNDHEYEVTEEGVFVKKD